MQAPTPQTTAIGSTIKQPITTRLNLNVLTAFNCWQRHALVEMAPKDAMLPWKPVPSNKKNTKRCFQGDITVGQVKLALATKIRILSDIVYHHQLWPLFWALFQNKLSDQQNFIRNTSVTIKMMNLQFAAYFLYPKKDVLSLCKAKFNPHLCKTHDSWQFPMGHHLPRRKPIRPNHNGLLNPR